VNDKLTYLFQKQLLYENAPEERQEFMRLMADPVNEPQVNDLLINHWEAFEVSNDAATNIFQPGQGEEILNTLLVKHVYPTLEAKKTVSIWPRELLRSRIGIAVAAAIATIIVATGVYFYKKPGASSVASLAYQNDIPPGVQGATLTLADGRKIKLSDAVSGKLASEAGVEITKSSNGQLIYEIKGSDAATAKINTLSTANGETYKIHLPDGSLVWLNAASSLTYTTNLDEHGKRKVKLTGEGYFEIAKDKTHPFIVETNGQQIEVLGTHFNVNCYQDEPGIATTLLEGSVKVTSENAQKIIKPGEQAMNRSGVLSVREIDLDNVIDWKNGDFFLNHVEFKSAMRKVARWYDMEIIYDKSVPDNMEAGGWISRDKPLSAVLRSVELSGMVKFKVEGRKIYVTR
jgi:transmembrane sensor